MDDKIYVGNGKIVQTSFGEMTKLSFHRDDVLKLLAYLDKNELQWINLDLKVKQSPKEGKATHYLEVNQWKPMKTNAMADKPVKMITDPGSDLPF